MTTITLSLGINMCPKVERLVPDYGLEDFGTHVSIKCCAKSIEGLKDLTLSICFGSELLLKLQYQNWLLIF